MYSMSLTMPRKQAPGSSSRMPEKVFYLITRVSMRYTAPVRRLVNLNADRKRFWLGTLESLDDGKCNDSVPISMSQFSKEMV